MRKVRFMEGGGAGAGAVDGAQFALSKFRDIEGSGGDFCGRNIIIKYSLSTVAKIVTARWGRVLSGNRRLRPTGTAHYSSAVIGSVSKVR